MKYNIAVLPGDGIGPEIMREAIKVLDAVADVADMSLNFYNALVGGAAWEKYGEHLPQATLNICCNTDAILFGSVGGPVAEQLSAKWRSAEKNSLLGLRKAFDFYANLRPARLYPQLVSTSPLREDIARIGFDMLIVRELAGGIYFGEPKGRDGAADFERGFDTMIYTRAEIKRIARIAFDLARQRRRKVTSIDKANVLATMVLWREVVAEIAKDYPDVQWESMYVDNAVMQLVRNPSQFDVILCGNMFGDILSDEAAALTGSLGNAPSASLSHNGFGMYEPAGGSAPDIAGKGIANPIGQILSAALMLRHSFNCKHAAMAIEKAVDEVLAEGLRTPDIWIEGCREVGTVEMGDRIAEKVKLAG